MRVEEVSSNLRRTGLVNIYIHKDTRESKHKYRYMVLYLYLIVFENEIEKLDMKKISLIISSRDMTRL